MYKYTGGVFLKKTFAIILFLIFFLFASISLASENFYGEYQGSLMIESFNEALVQSLAEDNNQFVNDLKQEIKESLSGNYLITISSSEGKDIIQFDGEGWIEPTFQENKISYKMILDEGVFIALNGEQDANGDISGNLRIQTPLGYLADGSFTMDKTISLDKPIAEKDSSVQGDLVEEEEAVSEEDDDQIEEENILEDPLVEDSEVIAIDNIPIYEPPSEMFLPISTLEDEYKGAKEVAVQKSENYLVDIYNENSDIEIEEDLNGRLKIYKSDPNDDLSYEKKKQVMKGSNYVIDKIVGETPVKYFVESANNLLKDEIYDREDQIRDTQEKLDMNPLEARGYNDVNTYDEKETILSPIKDYIADQDGVVGYSVGVVQKQLDKLADSKKKALGKAAAREYRNFAETYVESRKNSSHEEAIKAAHQRIEDLNYDAGADEGGEVYTTFKTSKSSFFKAPIKFLSHRILNRESKKKTVKERSSMYIGYLKEDKIYMNAEGGN